MNPRPRQRAWAPSDDKPIHIYHFEAGRQLQQALREVGAAEWNVTETELTYSTEALHDFLGKVARHQAVVVDKGTATILLGAPGESGAQLTLRIFDPLEQNKDKTEAIDDIKISNLTFGVTVATTRNSPLTLSASGPMNPAGTDTFKAPSLQFLGNSRNTGTYQVSSVVAREMGRWGTAMETKDGQGMTGYEYGAVGLIEVTGPKGTRWVEGDLRFRSTERAEEPNAQDSES